MPVNIPIAHFTPGQVGSHASGRSSDQMYNNSLQLCENFITLSEGPLLKRSGTKHLDDTYNVSNANGYYHLIPYRNSSNVDYMLEIQPGRITAWNADGTQSGSTTVSSTILTTSAATIKWAQQGDILILVDGDHEPVQFAYNGSTFTVSSLACNCGPLNSENLDPTTTLKVSAVSGTGLTIQFNNAGGGLTYFATAGLFIVGLRCIPQLMYSQWTTSTAYTAGDYVWSQSYESSRINVYKATNSATSGGRAPGHDNGTESDGSVTWQMVHSEYGFVRLTELATGSSDAECDVVCFPEIPASYTTGQGDFRWSLAAWGGAGGGPKGVCFYQGRLVLAGGEDQSNYGWVPDVEAEKIFNSQKIWASKSEAYDDFYPGTDENNAYNFQFSSTRLSEVRQLYVRNQLTIATNNGMYQAVGGNELPISPTNPPIITHASSIKHSSANGLDVQSSIVFTQEGGKTVREFTYSKNADSDLSIDISGFTNELEDLGLNDWVKTEVPIPVMWTYTNNGKLVGLTFDHERNIRSYHYHDISDTSEGAAEILAIGSLPDENQVNDRLWLVVRRSVDGVETDRMEWIDLTESVFLDAYFEYSGSATDTITGLDHLEGETVTVVEDGAVLGTYTVDSNQITLGKEVTGCYVGIPFTAKMKTQRLEGGSNIGHSQGNSAKKLEQAVMRLYQTGRGLYAGTGDGTNANAVNLRSVNNNTSAADPLISGDVTAKLPGGPKDEGVLYVDHRLPTACTIVGAYVRMSVSDKS